MRKRRSEHGNSACGISIYLFSSTRVPRIKISSLSHKHIPADSAPPAAAAVPASLVVVGSPCIAGDAVRLTNPAARGEPEASGDEGDNDTTSETRTRRRRPHKRALTTAVILGRDSGDNDDETVVNSNDNDIFARNPTALGVVHAGLCFRCACIIAFLQRRRDAFDVAHDAKTEPERFQSTCSYRFDSISCLSSITLT